MSPRPRAETGGVAERLREAYGDYAHGNKRRALDELLYILSSIKTTERKHAESYRSLRRAFPTYGDIAGATEESLAEALSVGGFQTVKAQTIRRAVDAIVERFGRPTLAPLRRMPDREAERELLALPGVGPKIARCVMMYALDREVFPVDTNCWRIAVRLGWIEPKPGGRQITAKDMDRLQERIPPGLRYSLHVNMVSHGRRICTPKRPSCDRCVLTDLCPQVGLDGDRAPAPSV